MKYKLNSDSFDYKNSKLNLTKAILLFKIKTVCQNLVEIYKYFRLRKKMKFFEKWRRATNFSNFFKKLENNVNEKCRKLYEPKINSLTIEIKNKQKIIEDLKNNEKVINISNKQLEKEKENFIKKEKKLNQKIEQSLKENSQYENGEMNSTNSINNQNEMNYKETIAKLEEKLKELEDEEYERKNYMEKYSEDMSNMMSVFEQKAQEIMRLQNNGHLRKKLEINTGNYGSINQSPDINFSEINNRTTNKFNN